MTWTTTDFLEVSAHVSSKIATNGSFRDKRIKKIIIFEGIISNQKRRSTTKVIHVFEMFLEALYLLQLYIFWKWVHAFYWKWPQGSLRIKKILKIYHFLGFYSKAKIEEWEKGNLFFMIILEYVYLVLLYINTIGSVLTHFSEISNHILLWSLKSKKN